MMRRSARRFSRTSRAFFGASLRTLFASAAAPATSAAAVILVPLPPDSVSLPVRGGAGGDVVAGAGEGVGLLDGGAAGPAVTGAVVTGAVFRAVTADSA